MQITSNEQVMAILLDSKVLLDALAEDPQEYRWLARMLKEYAEEALPSAVLHPSLCNPMGSRIPRRQVSSAVPEARRSQTISTPGFLHPRPCSRRRHDALHRGRRPLSIHTSPS